MTTRGIGGEARASQRGVVGPRREDTARLIIGSVLAPRNTLAQWDFWIITAAAKGSAGLQTRESIPPSACLRHCGPADSVGKRLRCVGGGRSVAPIASFAASEQRNDRGIAWPRLAQDSRDAAARTSEADEGVHRADCHLYPCIQRRQHHSDCP